MSSRLLCHKLLVEIDVYIRVNNETAKMTRVIMKQNSAPTERWERRL
jgi:hypothetical protein